MCNLYLLMISKLEKGSPDTDYITEDSHSRYRYSTTKDT